MCEEMLCLSANVLAQDTTVLVCYNQHCQMLSCTAGASAALCLSPHICWPLLWVLCWESCWAARLCQADELARTRSTRRSACT